MIAENVDDQLFTLFKIFSHAKKRAGYMSSSRLRAMCAENGKRARTESILLESASADLGGFVPERDRERDNNSRSRQLAAI